MTPEDITGMLTNRFPADILETDSSSDMLTITVNSRYIDEIVRFLKEDPGLGFEFLTTLCGINYPDRKFPLGVVYHLHNLEKNVRLRLKAFLPDTDPALPTISGIFSAANWMEREAWDFYGIRFTGHPNLIRILNVEYLDYFPLRKEYPLEDPTREDKDDRYFGR